MEPDDPMQLYAFLLNKGTQMRAYLGNEYAAGWLGAVLDMEVWLGSAEFRQVVANGNAGRPKS